MRSHVTLRVGVCMCTNRFLSSLPNSQGILSHLRDGELKKPLVIGFKTQPIAHGSYDQWMKSIRTARCHFNVDVHRPPVGSIGTPWSVKVVLLDFWRCRYPTERLYLGGTTHFRRAWLEQYGRCPSTRQLIVQILNILARFTHDQIWEWDDRIHRRIAA